MNMLRWNFAEDLNETCILNKIKEIIFILWPIAWSPGYMRHVNERSAWLVGFLHAVEETHVRKGVLYFFAQGEVD